MCARTKTDLFSITFFPQVSLFAELFNEMLQRDFGYRIYKALAAIPAKDEKKDKKKKEVEKWEAKKEKDEDNEEPQAKKAKEDEEDKKKVNLLGPLSRECVHAVD